MLQATGVLVELGGLAGEWEQQADVLDARQQTAYAVALHNCAAELSHLLNDMWDREIDSEVTEVDSEDTPKFVCTTCGATETKMGVPFTNERQLIGHRRSHAKKRKASKPKQEPEIVEPGLPMD